VEATFPQVEVLSLLALLLVKLSLLALLLVPSLLALLVQNTNTDSYFTWTSKPSYRCPVARMLTYADVC
jgi:hypothetical protein